jgi:hypothetical protein
MDMLTAPTVAVEQNAYAAELGKSSPFTYLGQSFFLDNSTPVIDDSGNLNFTLADDVDLYDYAIVSIQQGNDEYFFPIINGYFQPISYYPDFDAVLPTPESNIDVIFSIDDLYQYHQLAGDLVLYASTHNSVTSVNGQGSYSLTINGEVTLQGELESSDSSEWYMYNGNYYYDRYFLSIEKTGDDYELTVADESDHSETIQLNSGDTVTIDYTPEGSLQRPYFEMVIENHDVIVGTDYYFADQWHLLYAQAPYIWTDLVVTGDGVTVAVVEDDFQVTHPDLVNQMSEVVASVPVTPTGDDWHATAVAGVIAAQAGNGIGVAGVAPLADLVSINNGLELYEYGGTAIDIYSNSWGPTDDGTLHNPGWWSQELEQMQSATLNDNALVFFANGNGGGVDDVSTFDPLVNSIYSIAVQAIGQDNHESGYSEMGSNMVFSAYSNAWNYGEGITTTAPNDSYEFDFGGTSSATPLGAGMVALILEVAKDLSIDPSGSGLGLNWRDIISLAAHHSLATDLFDPAWEVNQAGVPHHPFYGFGTINAYSIIEKIQSGEDMYFISDEEMIDPNLSFSGSLSNSITIDSDDFSSGQDIIIDFVQLTLHTIDGVTVQHESLDVIISHASSTPSGNTESQLTYSHFVDANPQDITDYAFTSLNFWGESPIGEWEVSVSDDDGEADGFTYTLDIFYHIDSDGDGI